MRTTENLVATLREHVRGRASASRRRLWPASAVVLLLALLLGGALPARGTHDEQTRAIQLGAFELDPGKKLFLPRDGDGWVYFPGESQAHDYPPSWFWLSAEEKWKQCDSPGPGAENFTCWDFHLDVPELQDGANWRLRVAFDGDWANGRSPIREGDNIISDEFALGLRSPTHHYAIADSGCTGGCHGGEIFVPGSASDDDTASDGLQLTAGRWTARVFGLAVSNSRFRVRAALEYAGSASTSRQRLLPNLVPEPPVNMTFRYPDEIYPSCDPVELETRQEEPQGTEVCLRFRFGHANAGRGPLELRFELPATASVNDDGSVSYGGTATQRVYYSDGTYEDRPNAGTYSFWPVEHPETGDLIIHSHFHYNEMTRIELFRLDEQHGQLVPRGQPSEPSSCGSDRRMTRWNRFIQDATGTNQRCQEDPRTTLSTGWTWVYPYSVPKNAVLFGTVIEQPDGSRRFAPYEDGLYLLRITADPYGLIAETEETDNVGYTYVKVFHEEGVRKVQLLERGYGSLPTALGGDPANVIDACSEEPPDPVYPPNCEGPYQGE